MTVARTAMFAVIGVWLYLNYGSEVALRNLPPLTLFVLLGFAAYGLMHGRPGRFRLQYAFVLLDCLLLGHVLFAPGATIPEGWPWQTALRMSLFMFFLTFPALALLSFRPFLVLWSGLVAALTMFGCTAMVSGAITMLAM